MMINLNNVGKIVEDSSEIILIDSGCPFQFHLKNRKLLEFFAPKDDEGVRRFNIGRFHFSEALEDYNRIMNS